MATIEELEKTREMFRGDRFATEMGAVIDEIGDHYAKCSLVIRFSVWDIIRADLVCIRALGKRPYILFVRFNRKMFPYMCIMLILYCS